MLKRMSHHPTRHVYRYVGKNKNSNKRCHHCGRYGHIRPYCFRLHGYVQPFSQPRFKIKDMSPQVKKVWKPKNEVRALIAQTSVGMSLKDDWFFDSGCSNHMTCENSFLEEVKSSPLGYVTFEDGRRGRIKAIVKIIMPGLLCLKDVPLVEDLSASLVSINQLGD